QRKARTAGIPARRVSCRGRGGRPCRRPRSRPVRRYLQPHLRARKSGCCLARAGRGRLSRASAAACKRRTIALLRTDLPVGEARTELDRLVATYAPFAARGVPIIGLEPSCLLTLRDELLSLRSDEAAKAIGAQALTFEEFLVREAQAGRLRLPLGAISSKILL